MVATLCLLSCVWTTAQTADRPPPAPRPGAGWVLAPHLTRSQELVYRGSFTEEATGGGVQFNRAFRIECRAFVLDVQPQSADVAFLTVLKLRDAPPEANGQPGPGAVRLEVVHVDAHGKLEPAPGVSLAVPLEGPPGAECGAFVEAPAAAVALNQTWEVGEPGRPLRSWQVAGNEPVNGTSCLKLVGVQQSDDWDRPRADRTAWRRQDTVWLAPRLGIAYRVERVIERREPAREKPTQRSVLRYELESSLPYPKQLDEDRRQEIVQAVAFRDSAAPLLPRPARNGPKLEALLGKINHHLEHQPPTPYREAILQVKRRVEAAQRGESPPAPPPDPATSAPTIAGVGTKAPDFMAPDFGSRESARLQRWLGRPVVLVFYNPAAGPTAETTEDVLRFAQKLAAAYPEETHVLGLAMSDDAERVRRQRDALGLTFPLLNGSGLYTSYAVEATPKVMVLDGNGTVRGSYVGWGSETPSAVVEELKRWLPRQEKK